VDDTSPWGQDRFGGGGIPEPRVGDMAVLFIGIYGSGNDRFIAGSVPTRSAENSLVSNLKLERQNDSPALAVH
jgi:hypothetical protein